ncbi:MAG TPA: hypothetical protein VES70_21745, partial [Pseudomonas sp.]|nr:hypothetical protein [Pseudomonas sp.]
YEYDPLSNLTTLTLPDGRKVNHLYYGSGLLHLSVNGECERFVYILEWCSGFHVNHLGLPT